MRGLSRVKGFGVPVQGLGLRAEEFKVSGFRVSALGFRA